MKSYQDTNLAPAQRADALLRELSTEEKMGQLQCYFPQEAGNYSKLAEGFPHGIGQISCLEMRMLDSLEACAQMQRDIQGIVMEASPHSIPAIFHMEGVCGAFVQGAASFPTGLGRASSWNVELEQRIGEIVGRQERAVGITHTFAPVLDIARDARMGRMGETYGEDPALACALGAALTKGLQGGSDALHTEAVAKHFAGFHASEGGIHGTSCDISGRQLREIYAKPFQAAITEAGLRGIMPCYNSINGVPVSASREFLTDFLRSEMGFDGVTVSDYCAIMNLHTVQKTAKTYTQAGLQAMRAGLDMELHFKQCYNDELASWFACGKIDMHILDAAVRRVLEAKFRMGLFEQPYAYEGEALRKQFFIESAGQTSLQSARESLVLLKNDGVLPLSKQVKTLAVIGSQAATARIFYGGYTHFSMAEGMLAAISTMAGLQSEKGAVKPVETIHGSPVQKDDDPAFEEVLKKQNPGAKSLLQQLRESLPGTEVLYAPGYPVAGNDESGHDEALAVAQRADAVLLVLGGKYGTSSIASMGEGIDATDIGLPICQDSFIEKLSKLNKPAIGVHLNGRPISSDAADKHLSAILEAWAPAEAGAQAIVEVLLGEYNPGGKLTVSVAKNAGQIPVYYNHPNGSSYHQGESIGFSEYVDASHKPRYCFGHGLSYTQFEYGQFSISQEQVMPCQTFSVSVDVANCGQYAGDEVIQLYLRDCYASVTRPVLQLAGFRRVHLAPGETKRVTFAVNASQLAFWQAGTQWTVEAGEAEVLVGSSSENILCRGMIEIMETQTIDGTHRQFYC